MNVRPRHVILLLGVIVVVLSFYWLVWGRTLVLELGPRELNDIVDLSCFEGLHPDMTRSEVDTVMGQPARMHVTDIEYGEEGDIEYQEICWTYPREGGFLNYYVEEYDVPGGSVEYVPDNMHIDDFFHAPMKLGWGKRFVEIRGNQHLLVSVRIAKNGKIQRINWYWQR